MKIDLFSKLVIETLEYVWTGARAAFPFHKRRQTVTAGQAHAAMRLADFIQHSWRARRALGQAP